jgi:hypothetical protein
LRPRDLEVFHGGHALDGPETDLGFRCTPEYGAATLRVLRRCHAPCLAQGRCRSNRRHRLANQLRATQPLVRFRVPPAVIICAIRLTRVYLTRHLPPLVFLDLRRLTPAQTCSACFIRAPLMGFKEQRECNQWPGKRSSSTEFRGARRPKPPRPRPSLSQRDRSLASLSAATAIHSQYTGHRKEEDHDNTTW